MSLIENVIALIEQERAKEPFTRVSAIRLRLGALGHAEPEALRFCFAAVAAGTIAEGARLTIEMVQGEGWCSDCEALVPLADRYGVCPACAGVHIKMTRGDDLRLADMEVT